MTKKSSKPSISPKRVLIDIFPSGLYSICSKPCITMLVCSRCVKVSPTDKSVLENCLTVDPLSTVTLVKVYSKRFHRWTWVNYDPLHWCIFLRLRTRFANHAARSGGPISNWYFWGSESDSINYSFSSYGIWRAPYTLNRAYGDCIWKNLFQVRVWSI